ncbi:hypothetical protein MsAc7_05660 [Methanolapillus millepedarum]|uniref:Uncharacterized protein n=2 Tax=Methanolapillus millepedarum TaxID=3028296 RepID=A0AA97A3H9_9EURY|nr:hypothetical protein MsAc7_05660 [Methanosarcinaceae archaeon Ac7]
METAGAICKMETAGANCKMETAGANCKTETAGANCNQFIRLCHLLTDCISSTGDNPQNTNAVAFDFTGWFAWDFKLRDKY